MVDVCWWWPLQAASSLRRKGNVGAWLVSRVGLRDRWRRGRATSTWFSGDGVGDLSVCGTVGDTAVAAGTNRQYIDHIEGARRGAVA